MQGKNNISSIEEKRQFIKDLYAGRKSLKDIAVIKTFDLNLFTKEELKILLDIKLKYLSAKNKETEIEQEDLKQIENLTLLHEKRNNISQIKSTL